MLLLTKKIYNFKMGQNMIYRFFFKQVLRLTEHRNDVGISVILTKSEGEKLFNRDRLTATFFK